MIDLWIAIKRDATAAIERTRACDRYAIAWIEEPLGVWDPNSYSNFRERRPPESLTASVGGMSTGINRYKTLARSMWSASTPAGFKE